MGFFSPSKFSFSQSLQLNYAKFQCYYHSSVGYTLTIPYYNIVSNKDKISKT